MNKKGSVVIIVIIVAVLAISVLLYLKTKGSVLTQLKQNITPTAQPLEQKGITEGDQLKSYTSQDLKISFEYPKDWYIDEKDFDIMMTSYKTKIGENKPPGENEIKIFIDNFNGCHDTIEENLIDPACGEGRPSVKKNTILSKEARQTEGGTFYKYVVQTPNNQFTYYLLEKGDKILHIEKHPDPSQFEKEFEEIINSIRFL